MKHFLSLLALVLVASMTVAPNSASAQGIKVGPHAGLNLDGTEVFLGLGAQFDLPVMEREMWGNVGFDYYPFIDGASSTSVSLDVLFPFGVGNLAFYGGGGLGFTATSFDNPLPNGDESDTDIGLNLKAGWLIGSRADGYRPFIELDQSIGNGSNLAIRGGVFVAIGGR